MIRPTRLLPFLLAALGPAASAVPLTVDFDSANPPANSEHPLANPWIEDGMHLACLQPTTSQTSDLVMRTYTNNNSGTKSPGAKWSLARFEFRKANSGKFTMKSIRLIPYMANLNSTVTFTGIKHAGGAPVNVTLATGSSLAGTVHQFPAGFNELSEVRWAVDNNIAGAGYHQFDDLVVELPTPVTVPAAVTISEGSGPVVLALQRGPGASGDLVLTPAIGGTATAATDYGSSLLPGGSVHFSGSDPTAAFTVEALADGMNEAPETIVLTWPAGPDHVLSQPTTTVTIGDTNGTGFADYMSGHGLAGNDALADADPDGDGVANLSAYLHRLNPAGPTPAGWRERLPKFTTVSGGGRAVLPAITWQVPQPWPADVRCIVHESDTLAAWAETARRGGYGIGSLWTGTVSATVQDGGSPVKTVVVQGTQAIEARPAAFQRLVLELISGGIE